MLKKIVSLILITISSFFIISNFKEVKDYDDNVDLLIEKNNINRKYDGYISFKNKKWLIKYGDYNEILNQKEDKKLERWMRIVKEASEQSMRVNIPIITEVKKMSELENETGLKLVCSTKEKENTIKMFLQSHKSYDKINIVIGPEGGISPKEEEYLNNIGFQSISLGKNIMRVETVPLYILSVLNYENME